MPTIALYANNVSQLPGLIGDVKNSVNNYITELSSLKNKALNVNKSVCNIDDVIISIQSSTQTQEQKINALDKFQQNCENYIADAVRIDSDVADTVNKNKDDFYADYYYLKPDCEKSVWEKFCDGLASANEWCKENWESIVNLICAVVIIVAIVALCVVTFGAAAVGVAALVGAIVGVASQFAADCVTSLITGEAQFSGILTYFGAAIGGAVGGILMLTGNPVLASSVDSAISTFVGGHLENLVSDEKDSSAKILLFTGISGFLGGLFSAGLSSITGKFAKSLSKTFPALSRLAGSGSYEASFKAVLTRLANGNARNFTWRTLRNGIVSGLGGSFFENIADGIWNGLGVWFERWNLVTVN
jgi:hypothetical protein